MGSGFSLGIKPSRESGALPSRPTSIAKKRHDESYFAAAWKLLVQRSDKRRSFADCTSFVLMENRDLRKALTFDRNSLEAGFAMIP